MEKKTIEKRSYKLSITTITLAYKKQIGALNVIELIIIITDISCKY